VEGWKTEERIQDVEMKESKKKKTRCFFSFSLLFSMLYTGP